MIKAILSYCKEWTSNICEVIKLRFKSSVEKDIEIPALKSQCSKWESFLAIFRPATVVKWHREAFKL